MDKSRQNSPSTATTKKSYKAQIKALKGELKASKKEKENTTEEIAAAISTAFASLPATKANASSAMVRIRPPTPSQANAATVAITGILKPKREKESTA